MKTETGCLYDKGIAKIYYKQGVAHAIKGEFSKAIENFDRAIALNPKNAQTYFMRGRTYGDINETSKAIEDYDKAIELDPTHMPFAYSNRRQAYIKIGER